MAAWQLSSPAGPELAVIEEIPAQGNLMVFDKNASMDRLMGEPDALADLFPQLKDAFDQLKQAMEIMI